MMETTGADPTIRRQPDRFLLAILGGIVLLLLVALVSVVALRRPAPDLPAGTPGGVVQRFYGALEQRDYAEAYGFLSAGLTNTLRLEDFVTFNAQNGSNGQQTRGRIDSEKTSGDQSTVTVSVTHFYSSGGPFSGSSEYTSSETFTLRREAGAWRITSLPYNYAPPAPPR
jgi:hypothetical protein